MKAPVPGDVLRRVDSTELLGTHVMFEGTLIHACEYPPPEWLDRHPHIAEAWNGFPRGWWCVLQDGTPTYHLRYGTIYVYDGNRWRKQEWKHLAEEDDAYGLADLDVDGPAHVDAERPAGPRGENAFELVSEEYLAEGEDP